LSAYTIKNVNILTADGLIGDSISVAHERVTGLNRGPQSNETIIDGLGGMLIPGLINAHDHLSLNNFNRTKYQSVYTNASQWIGDIEKHIQQDTALIAAKNQPLPDRLMQGAIKNLLSGVTTVCHHDPDYAEFGEDYPLRLVRPYQYSHSLYIEPKAAQSYQNAEPDIPWIIHLAEGFDDQAQAEFSQLLSQGAIKANCILVHGIGLSADELRLLSLQGGGLIWCPSSNDFLFQRTADVALLNAAGKVALGSDSRLSGGRDLLTEIKAAASSEQVTAQDIFKQVTINPARMLMIREGGAGAISIGSVADLVLLPATTSGDPYQHLQEIERSQLQLVILAGQPIIASDGLKRVFQATGVAATPVTLDGERRLLASHLYRRLQASKVSEPGLEL
jgi:cytosine/adenosine deaminase-related metal-dependent hydrolase